MTVWIWFNSTSRYLLRAKVARAVHSRAPFQRGHPFFQRLYPVIGRPTGDTQGPPSTTAEGPHRYGPDDGEENAGHQHASDFSIHILTQA